MAGRHVAGMLCPHHLPAECNQSHPHHFNALQDRKLLLRSTVVTKASCDWAEGDDVRGLKVRARIFSVDGPSVVDVAQWYHNRPR